MGLRILVDTAQQRLVKDGVSTLVTARDWDPALCENVFLDGITGTVFLMPGCFESDWLDLNTGIYAKLPSSAFTLTPAASDPNWTLPVPNADGAEWYKYANNTTGAGGISSFPVVANQPIVFETSRLATTGGVQVIGDCGWGASGDYTTGVSCRFYSNNSVDVYKEGVFLGNYALSGQIAEYGQTDGQVPSQATPPFVTYLLLPCRGRELLILSSTGGGTSIIFEDIPEGTEGAEITPAAPIWFYATAGVDAQMRMALCRFQDSGYAVGKKSYFRYDPGASPEGGFQTWTSGDTPGSTTIAAAVGDGANPLIPYISADNGVRVRALLRGDGTYSPTLYAARGYTLTQVADTWGENPLDLTDYFRSFSLESSDSVSGERCVLELKDPRGIEAAGIALDAANKPGWLIDCVTDRPWQIWWDDVLLMEGVSEPPKRIYKPRLQSPGETNPGEMTYGDQTSTNELEAVQIVIRNGWRLAEIYEFKEAIPFDGMTVADAYTLVSDTTGLTASGSGRSPDLDPALSGITISKAGAQTKDFNMCARPGDKGSEWLDRFVKTKAANYFHGITPGAGGGWSQPHVLSSDTLGADVDKVLYDSDKTAIAHSVADPDYPILFRKCDQQMLSPEANDIYAQGVDFRTMRPMIVHKEDSAGMDVTLPPASRTPGSRLGRVSYSWTDPTLSDMDTLLYVEGLLYDRLTAARSMIEIECEFDPILWRASVVQLYFLTGGGLRDPSTGEYANPASCRIKTLSFRVVQTGDDGASSPWNPCRYVAQFGNDASTLNLSQTTLKGISEAWSTRSISRSSQWSDASDKGVYMRPFLIQGEA